MSEKRSFPRSIVDLVAHVNIDGERIDAKILDLTVEGISMELDQIVTKDIHAVINIEKSQDVKAAELQIETIRCIPADPSKYHLTARFIEPNDEFLMDALALVHGIGPKQDRRGTIYGKR
mgnify:CR=1 FL=1